MQGGEGASPQVGAEGGKPAAAKEGKEKRLGEIVSRLRSEKGLTRTAASSNARKEDSATSKPEVPVKRSKKQKLRDRMKRKQERERLGAEGLKRIEREKAEMARSAASRAEKQEKKLRKEAEALFQKEEMLQSSQSSNDEMPGESAFQDSDDTLACAIRGGMETLPKELLISGEYDARQPLDEAGNEAMHYAARFANALVIEIIVAVKAAEIHDCLLAENSDGQTPFAIAQKFQGDAPTTERLKMLTEKL